jgi:uncharacterized repeat protein (TIGR03803 family)
MFIPRFARRLFTHVAALLLTAAIASAVHADTKTTITTTTSLAPLIEASDGNFYGVSNTGGSSSQGYVFRLTPGGTTTIIYNFTGGADGGTPLGSLIEGNDGNLYGTDTTGGSGFGVLYKLTSGGTLTVLHSFVLADGIVPNNWLGTGSSLIQNNAGDFFGTAPLGGSSNSGTIYEYNHSGVFSVLHTFTGGSSDGAIPSAPLMQASDGLLYGATDGGTGTIFRLDPTNPTSSYTIVGTFPPPPYSPSYGMTEGPDGALYGLAAEGGGSSNDQIGSIFRVTLGGTPTLTPDLFLFNGGGEGGLPISGLTLGGDGNFYGTTSSYGPGAPTPTGPPNGTVFQFVPTGSGSLNTLYGFSSPDGNLLAAPLISDRGILFGPSATGIYQLAPATIPPINITALPSSIQLGQSSTLSWTVANAYSQTMENCYAHGAWSGSHSGRDGSQTITPTAVGTYTYALTCGGVESGFATLTVTPSVVALSPAPVVKPSGGTFAGPVSFQITVPGSPTQPTAIYYTTNGNSPTVNSPVWSVDDANREMVIDQNTTIKTIAVVGSQPPSSVTTATFVINNTGPEVCTINYANGFSPANGLQINHGATISGTELLLTNNQTFANTSAFATKRIQVGATAVSDFHFRFDGANADSADGFAFVVQANSPAAVGSYGGGLGYAGIPNSMALKFDLHNNAGEGPNSVGLFFGGAEPTVPAIDLTPSGINLHSGHTFAAHLTSDRYNLTLDLTDVQTSAHFSRNFALPIDDPFGTYSAYVGFTAGTGAKTSKTEILDWSLESAASCQ